MMRVLCAAATAWFMCGFASAGDAATSNHHRYLIERTFPAGALAGVTPEVKKTVNANNESLGVTWEKSYANVDLTKTYCVYEGPSEIAVREAAKLNGLPVDTVTEIPADLKAEPKGAVQKIAPGKTRYFVKRAGTARVSGADDAKFGVTLLTSYAAKDASFWVYEAPSMEAVEKAAKAAHAPIDSIAVVPATLYPY